MEYQLGQPLRVSTTNNGATSTFEATYVETITGRTGKFIVVQPAGINLPVYKARPVNVAAA